MRIVTTAEMKNIREAWAGVAAIVSCNPLFLPQRSFMDEIHAAVPELKFRQPRWILRIVVQSGDAYKKKEFGEDLAVEVGTVSRTVEELSNGDVPKLVEQSLQVAIPIYMEDDPYAVISLPNIAERVSA